MFKKILVCLDGSNLAEQILPYVTEMALQYSTKVVLLRVIPAKVEVATGVSKQTPLSVEERVEDYVEGVAASMVAAGVDV